MKRDAALAPLIAAASEYYRGAGRFALHFARGKLAGDPVFAALLAKGLLAGRTRILDLGCGQGLLAAWLLAARACHQADWPRGWPPPPRLESYLGIEIAAREAARARCVQDAGAALTVVLGDIRDVDYGSTDAAVILDVLHFIDYAQQETVLERVRAALARGGQLVLRVGDAAAGTRFALSAAVDRCVALARRGHWPQLRCRPLDDWQALLARSGFRSRAVPISAGTPFANFLLIAAAA